MSSRCQAQCMTWRVPLPWTIWCHPCPAFQSSLCPPRPGRNNKAHKLSREIILVWADASLANLLADASMGFANQDHGLGQHLVSLCVAVSVVSPLPPSPSPSSLHCHGHSRSRSPLSRSIGSVTGGHEHDVETPVHISFSLRRRTWNMICLPQVSSYSPLSLTPTHR